MAQEQSPTKKGYVELVKLAIGTAADAWSHIACTDATFTCDEDFENFSSGDHEIDANGLDRASATMTAEQTTIAGDTIQATHQFTCDTASQDVYGFAVFNSATKDLGDALMSCKFAAVQALEVDDKLTCTGKCQIKKD